MTLARFLLVRLVTGVLGLLVFASAIWLLSVWLVPGDFTSNFSGITGEERDAIRAALGLDRPLFEQYLGFMGGLLQSRSREYLRHRLHRPMDRPRPENPSEIWS